MQDFGTKADDTAGPSGQLSAAEFNNLATELENAVLRSGLALSGASATQIASSLFLHAVKAQTFQDGGATNAYVATPVSGSGGVLLPADYAQLNGMIISFSAANANTGAATLNIGQTTGTLLGAKAIVDQAGAALASGLISAGTYIQLRYDSSIGAGSWVLLNRLIATAAQSQGLTDNNTILTPLRLADAFKGANQSLVTNGFQKLPGGFILQYGTTAATTTSAPVVFPVAFPTAVRFITTHDFGAAATISIFQVNALTLAGFTAENICTLTRGVTTVGATVSSTCPWFAIGH